MRRGCGGGEEGRYVSGRSGVERKLLAVGGKLAVGWQSHRATGHLNQLKNTYR